jgi:hypothetical protein
MVLNAKHKWLADARTGLSSVVDQSDFHLLLFRHDTFEPPLVRGPAHRPLITPLFDFAHAQNRHGSSGRSLLLPFSAGPFAGSGFEPASVPARIASD